MIFSGLRRHAVFVVFAAAYTALLWFQVGHGLASGDAHGIVRTVQALVEKGQIEVSRPPGHPTTEFYLFGVMGWTLLKIFGVQFGDGAYLICQAIGALTTLLIFYELLLCLGTIRFRSFLATFSLAFSAQFFFNAIDGEEFIFGILFLLVSVRLLASKFSNTPRLVLSILCFALATGCRPELAFAAIIFPVYCALHSKLGWKFAIVSMVVLAVAVLIVWIPVLLVGIRAPYTAGMNLRQSLLGGAYRVVFQCFTLPLFLVFCWIVITDLRDWRKRLQSHFPANFIFAVGCIIPLIFLPVFFLHPAKAGHLLVAVPFVLLLAAERSLNLLLTVVVLTLAGAFVNIDIFKDRQLMRPSWAAGSYFQAIRQKPFYKLNYLRQLLNQCGDRPAVIIGNAWPWDFEYHVERDKLPVSENDLHGEIKRDIPAFVSVGERCLFLPPDAAFEHALLQEWQLKGYAMKMDAKLYHTLFARYDVRSAFSSGTVDASGVSFSLFQID